jgi:tetratricopeptide (TPR) repeat protein
LKEATELVPTESAMRLQLGWVYYSNLEGEKARVEFEKAIATSPSAMAFLYLGLTEIGLGGNEPAIAALREAIRLDPGLLDANVALGKVLAARAARRGSVLARHSDRWEQRRSSFPARPHRLRRGHLDSASGSFAAALEADPEHLQAWYNRALVAERLGRDDEARAAWARVAELRASGAEDPEAKRRTRPR